jgi:hypothetical protein
MVNHGHNCTTNLNRKTKNSQTNNDIHIQMVIQV